MPVIIRGADELEQSLKRAGSELAELTDAHARASRVVAAAVRAPRASGRLAASIRPAPRPTAASVEAGVDYAHIVEYGSRYMRARPYLGPAFESTRAQWLDIYAAETQEVLNRVRGA